MRKPRTQNTEKEGIQRLALLKREDYLTAIVLSTLTFVVYAFTAAPGVTLADSGDFINGVLTLGIVHPSGYPLYTVLGHLFSLLPFGEPAFRVNLFSALWGSLCLGVMFLILRILSIERIHAVFATLFLGFTTVFWSKTAVAEVYSFNAFLIACLVFWILSYNRDKKRSQLYLIFLTTGLALSNHYPLVLLSGVGLVFLLDRRDLTIGDFLRGLLFLALGLTPYLYLFIQASNPDLQYNFGQLSDFRMVLDHISRKYYADEYGGTVWDKFLLSFTVFKATLTNFCIASVFLYFGLVCTFLQRWEYRYPLLIAALSPSLGLILILTFPSEDKYKAFLLAFLIPSFLFLSVFLSIGLKTLMNRYVTNGIVQISLLIIILLSQLGLNFPRSSHHNDRLAEIWGAELLKSLKPDSILIIGEQGDKPLLYLQLVKGLRQDVTLYDRFSLVTKDNLYHPWQVFRYKQNDADELRQRYEEELITNSGRAIYYTWQEVLDEQHMSFTLTPFLYRADKRHFEASAFGQFTLSEDLLDSLIDGYPKSDHWLDSMRMMIFNRSISFYGRHDGPELNRVLKYFLKSKFSSHPKLNLTVANNLHYSRNYDLASQFYERAEELSVEAFSSRDLAVYCNILGRGRNYEKALPICMKQEHTSAPCEDTTVATQQTITNIYKEQRNWRKVAEYSRKILQCQPDHKIAQRYLELATQEAK